MSDLISRQDAIDECDKQYPNIDRQDFKAVINAVPSADAVEVVRCKDCKCSDVYQSDSSGATAMYCRAFTFHRMVAEDDYCSYGERREP